MNQESNTNRITTQKSAEKSSPKDKPQTGFTAEERAAMKQRARELKAAERGQQAKAEGESEVNAAIAEMVEPDRSMAARLHEIIKTNAPGLAPKLWYGMPAYARDGKVICFFQASRKFKTRYATLGFSDEAHLDEGALWPVAFAVKELTASEEAKVVALVKKAVS